MRTSSYAFLTSMLFSLPVLAMPQADVEKTISEVCSSPLPVVVVDEFMVPGLPDIIPYVDLNGDEVSEVAHGELVTAFLAASGKKTIPLNLLGATDFEEIAEVMKPLLKQVKAGKLKISALNISRNFDISFEGINKDLGLSTTSETIKSEKKTVHDRMRAMMDKLEDYGFGHLSDIFAEFEKLHIPIFVAAGNTGRGTLSILSFMPGTIPVGAKAIDGLPSETSARNNLVQVWRYGEHVLRHTANGGIDVNNDGIADFARGQLSTRPNIVDQYVGKPLSALLRSLPTDPDLPLMSRKTPAGIKYLKDAMSDGLYKTEDLISYFKIENTPFAKVLMKRAPYFHKDQHLGFNVDSSGRVVFDPAHDGTRDQAVLVGGTSFATASICEK